MENDHLIKLKLIANFQLTNIICWISSLIFGLLLIISLRDWIGYDIVMDLSARAFYSAFSKLAWSLALTYITIACYYGYGGKHVM